VKKSAIHSLTEQTSSVKPIKTDKIKTVLLKLIINDAKYPQHHIEFIEKVKGDGDFA